MYLEVLCDTPVNADSLPLLEVGLPVLGGDSLLVTGGGEPGVHVRHHLDLQVLHHLHLLLVHLGHRHGEGCLKFVSH